MLERWGSAPAILREPGVRSSVGGPVPTRRKQLTDQVGALAEAPRLARSHGGKVGFDLFQHPRERGREREQGAVAYCRLPAA